MTDMTTSFQLLKVISRNKTGVIWFIDMTWMKFKVLLWCFIKSVMLLILVSDSWCELSFFILSSKSLKSTWHKAWIRSPTYLFFNRDKTALWMKIWSSLSLPHVFSFCLCRPFLCPSVCTCFSLGWRMDTVLFSFSLQQLHTLCMPYGWAEVTLV